MIIADIAFLIHCIINNFLIVKNFEHEKYCTVQTVLSSRYNRALD